jgi:divalent metal cation (Fe/Co/Zn/Cd) transporter
MIHMLAILVIIPIIFAVLYINAISKTLRAIDPDMRTQSPGMAWLLLVPVFNVIWFFFLIKAIQDGFSRMQEAGRLKKDVDTGYNIGLAAGICWVATFIPRLMFLAFIPLFVFSVLHWNKLQRARQAVIQ